MTEPIRAVKPVHDPWIPLPSKAQMAHLVRSEGVAAWNDLMRRRNEAIAQAARDPFHFGAKLPCWMVALALLGIVPLEEVPKQWRELPAFVRLVESPAGEREAIADELLILGGNRASKSDFAAWLTVREALRCPGAIIWCLQEDEANSLQMQQEPIWRYLPPELKALNNKRQPVAKIGYHPATGFVNNQLMLPHGTLIDFRFYSMKVRKIEGGNLGCPTERCIGYWADELVPPDWVETLRYRCVTHAAYRLITFTPKDGYTHTVRMFLDTARTVVEQEAPLLPLTFEPRQALDLRQGASAGSSTGTKGENGRVATSWERMPRIQVPAQRQNARVLYFWSEENPYGGYPQLVRELRGASRADIRLRAYGWPEQAMGAAFPLFKDKVHVFTDGEMPSEGTRWMFCDPAQGRNWVGNWVLVDADGEWWIYREFPCPSRIVPGVGLPGFWAEIGEKAGHKHDGIPGEAARNCWGWGILDYKAEFARLERWADYDVGQVEDFAKVELWDERIGAEEPIFGRFIDSRFANTPKTTAQSYTTLLMECMEYRLMFEPMSVGVDSVRSAIKEGVIFINDRLRYNPERRIGWDNHPKLHVHEACENHIFMFKLWTGHDGQKGATKDFADLVRYAALLPIYYVDPERTLRRRGGYRPGGGRAADPHRANKKEKYFGRSGRRGR